MLAASSSAVQACSAQARAARWRIWAPVLLRAVALAIALLGLAGIGSVASRAPEPSSPAVARAGLELGALSSGALAFLAAGTENPGPGTARQAMSAALGAANTPVAQANTPVEAASTAPGAVSSSPGSSSAPLVAASTPSGGAASAAAALGSRPNDPAGTPCPEAAPARASGRSRPSASELRVALNQAEAAELQRLPGVGAKRAEAIIQLRERLGRFRRPNELLRIKGIGPRTLERMLPHLVLE